MIVGASPAPVILINLGLFLFLSQLFKVETSIEEVTGIVTIRAVGV